MTIFGINLNLDTSGFDNPNLSVALTEKMLKRKDERELFKQFLDSKLADGTTVFESICNNMTGSLTEDRTEIPDEILVDFVTRKLKQTQNSHINLYQHLLRKIVEETNPKFSLVHKQIDNNKFDGKVPFGYPAANKEAEGLLQAKIKDSINDKVCREYLTEKKIEESLKLLSKEMFLGINNFELKEKELIRYLLVLYELDLLEDYPGISPRDLKTKIAEAIKNKSELKLVHIKCLRFVYPKSGGVDILTDVEDKTIEGVLGRYSPKSEKLLFPRLQKIKDIFTNQDINVNFQIVLADNDLELLFPEGNVYVDKNQKSEARRKLKLYFDNLLRLYSHSFKFINLTDLTKNNDDYKKFQQEILRDLNANGGKFVNPDFFEKDRVDHQYEYYQQLFGSSYSRSEARRSISEQTASTMALAEALKIIGANIILVEENRGGENKLIANSKYPIFFTKLRDEAIFN